MRLQRIWQKQPTCRIQHRIITRRHRSHHTYIFSVTLARILSRTIPENTTAGKTRAGDPIRGIRDSDSCAIACWLEHVPADQGAAECKSSKDNRHKPPKAGVLKALCHLVHSEPLENVPMWGVIHFGIHTHDIVNMESNAQRPAKIIRSVAPVGPRCLRHRDARDFPRP